MTPADLTAAARALGHPIYGVQGLPAGTLELTRRSDGGVYLRYLPRGVAVGSSRQAYVTVGTYPMANAIGSVRAAAATPGAVTDPLVGGGLGTARPAFPRNVYMAYPGASVLIEVYAPSARYAHRLVRSGRVLPLYHR